MRTARIPVRVIVRAARVRYGALRWRGAHSRACALEGGTTMARSSRSRSGGVLVGVVTVVSLVSLISVSVLTLSDAGTTNTATTIKKKRVPPGDIAATLILAGVTPERLAACG